MVLSIGSTIMPRDLPDKVLGDVQKEKCQPLEEKEEGNPALMLQQSLRQSFYVGIPEEGINLKKTVEEFEKELLLEALEKTGWVKNKAANLLGLNRTTLVEKLKKLKIPKPIPLYPPISNKTLLFLAPLRNPQGLFIWQE